MSSKKITSKNQQNIIKSVHLLVEFWGCNRSTLNDHDLLVTSIEKAAKESNATVLNISSHQFSPEGVTIIALLAESHLSIHTWPEYHYAAIDVFTCGDKMKPHKTIEILEELLRPEISDVQEVNRGMKKVQ